MLIKQGSDKSARLILKVLGPNLTGSAPLNDIVAASAINEGKKQSETKLTVDTAATKAANTGIIKFVFKHRFFSALLMVKFVENLPGIWKSPRKLPPLHAKLK
jgi:hypothetical protein